MRSRLAGWARCSRAHPPSAVQCRPACLRWSAAAPDGSGPLELARGIEIGHVFQLGRKYAEALDLKVLDENGKLVTVTMGSYGIGVSRLVAAVIEAKCVEGVMKWPLVISPFDIAIIPLNNKSDTAPLDKARKIYETLKNNSIDVILDDTLESPSSKFKNFDLIGVPFQIIIGSKSSEDKFEFKELNAKTEMLSIDEIIKKIKKLKG